MKASYLRYFDGETWWYEQRQISEELGITISTLYRWRCAKVKGIPLIRTLKMNKRTMLALVDVFWVVENRDRLTEAGILLSSEKVREYSRRLQAISLEVADRRGEQYTLKELLDLIDRHGGTHTLFEEAIEHGRTYYAVAGGSHYKGKA